MKINVPSEKEFEQQQKTKRRQAVFGFIAGLFFFGFVGSKIFMYGFSEVKTYTWIALGIGVASFSYLAYTFGSDFWNTFR